MRRRLWVENDDDGFQALEFAAIFPLIIVFLLLATGANRVFAARNEITAAAHSGARAGSLANAGYESGAADTQARRSLTSGRHCTGAVVSTSIRDAGTLRFVQTNVTCSVSISDLGGLPFRSTVTATAEEVIDRDRA
jgi:Flp pilus assembly protein TadG